ncbi:hypothetical protein SAMN05421786_1011007 [Chryseobacterium ureilyticum]|uniref:Uncharacterized protein n=1 Tax=Chryseobacterium ureilyticum TaxID=373668 RepID=A0A1N7L4F0_9FLAO|nr:hypothetical protein SAMN05421786_1011007 [Chryseobacterium ureilyticum]
MNILNLGAKVIPSSKNVPTALALQNQKHLKIKNIQII